MSDKKHLHIDFLCDSVYNKNSTLTFNALESAEESGMVKTAGELQGNAPIYGSTEKQGITISRRNALLGVVGIVGVSSLVGSRFFGGQNPEVSRVVGTGETPTPTAETEPTTEIAPGTDNSVDLSAAEEQYAKDMEALRLEQDDATASNSDIAMESAPGDASINVRSLSRSENLTDPGRMSAEDVRGLRLENKDNDRAFMTEFYTDKKDVLLPGGKLDVKKASEAYLAGVEALLNAGCDPETLEEGGYLNDLSPDRFVSDIAKLYDMPMVRGIMGNTIDMPTDRYLREESLGFIELVMAAAASRRRYWLNAKRQNGEEGNLNQRTKVVQLDSELIGREDFKVQGYAPIDRHRVDLYAQLSNEVPASEAQPLPIVYPEGNDNGLVPVCIDLDPAKSQVAFMRVNNLEISLFEEFGRRY